MSLEASEIRLINFANSKRTSRAGDEQQYFCKAYGICRSTVRALFYAMGNKVYHPTMYIRENKLHEPLLVDGP